MAVSWAGAAAPGAQIVLVPTATTSATDGLDLSLATIVDQALAHTVAVGYSACEASLSETHQAFYAALGRLPLRALRSLLPRATAAPRPAMWRAAIRRSARAMALTLWPPRPGIQPWAWPLLEFRARQPVSPQWRPGHRPTRPIRTMRAEAEAAHSIPPPVGNLRPHSRLRLRLAQLISGCCRTWPCRQQSIPA